MQGLGRTGLEPTRLEAQGKAEQDKEMHGERLALLTASQPQESVGKATPAVAKGHPGEPTEPEGTVPTVPNSWCSQPS